MTFALFFENDLKMLLQNSLTRAISPIALPRRSLVLSEEVTLDLCVIFLCTCTYTHKTRLYFTDISFQPHSPLPFLKDWRRTKTSTRPSSLLLESSYVSPLLARWSKFSKQVAWITHHSPEVKHLVPRSSWVPQLTAQTQLSVATWGVICWSQINIPDTMCCRKGIRLIPWEAARLCLLFPSVFFMGLIFLNADFPNSCFAPLYKDKEIGQRQLTKRLLELQQNCFMVFRNCAISQLWNNILKCSSLLQTVTGKIHQKMKQSRGHLGELRHHISRLWWKDSRGFSLAKEISPLILNWINTKWILSGIFQGGSILT